jgi:hypothetical protein
MTRGLNIPVSDLRTRPLAERKYSGGQKSAARRYDQIDAPLEGRVLRCRSASHPYCIAGDP